MGKKRNPRKSMVLLSGEIDWVNGKLHQRFGFRDACLEWRGVWPLALAEDWKGLFGVKVLLGDLGGGSWEFGWLV